MVTAAIDQHRDRYTIIGVPTDNPADERAIAEFISGRNVDVIVHLADASAIWRTFQARSLPSWATVSASGEVAVGGGSLPASVLAGDWVD